MRAPIADAPANWGRRSGRRPSFLGWSNRKTDENLLLIFLLFFAFLLEFSQATSPVSACLSALVIHVPWAGLIPKNRPLPNFLVIEYSPPRGHPSSPFTLRAPRNRTEPIELAIPINGTWPSVGYRYQLHALYDESELSSNSTAAEEPLLKGLAYSSPGRPLLVSVAPAERSCTLAYLPPAEPYAKAKHFMFHLEYFPVDQPETVFFARTNATSVRLRRLIPSTQYRLALYAEFFGIRSLCPLELTFRTKSRQPVELNGQKTEEQHPLMKALQQTRNGTETFSSFDTGKKANSTKESAEIGEIADGKNYMESEGKEEHEKNEEMPQDVTVTNTTEDGQLELTTKPMGQEKEIDEVKEEQQPEDEQLPEETSSQAVSTPISTGSPIRVRQLGPARLQLSWEQPELVPCDAFLVRHNASEPVGKGMLGEAVRTSRPMAEIPLVKDAMIQVNVSCLFENTISPQWSAQRLVDLRRPLPARSLRLIRALTDDFFRSSVLLGFGLSAKQDFQFYQLEIGWAQGKKVVGNQHRLFRGEHIVNGEGRLNITGLEPASLYTFAVRNVSRELPGQRSAPIGLRLTTPPCITSTLYAGKVTPRSINVNFGESDPEHPFDHYELRFEAAPLVEEDNGEEVENEEEEANSSSGNRTGLVVRRLAKNDAKSLTFNKLVPGKTYRFSLFTLLKGVRSRPVVALITTYPLKVAALHPLMGPGSVLLFWTPENPAGNVCRFRLSYTASAGPHLHRAVSLELNGTTRRHRFSGLDWNTFYTFTITVIMGPPEAEAESESESLTIGMAGKPRTMPLLQRYGSRELVLTFANDREAFSDRNGAISQIAIIVAERTDGTPEQVGDVWELPSWHDVRERADGTDLPWDAFRASPSEYNPFGRRNPPATAQFVIGAEDCAAERRRLDEPYCNGPLRAGIDYWVKVRSYSVAGIAMETAWVGIDGMPASLSSAAANKEAEKKRRLPCYLYLNGCNNGGSSAFTSTQFWMQILPLFTVLAMFPLIP